MQFERVAYVVDRSTGVDVADYVAFVAGSSDEPEVSKEWEEPLERAEATMRETGEIFKGLG